MKKYTIYQISNLLNGKIYIGKHETFNLSDSYMGSGKDLTPDINKHGLENFKKDILFIFNTEEEMNAKEAELVTEEFCDRKDTYNICPGGKGGWGYINKTGKNLYSKNGQSGYGLENIINGQHLKKLQLDLEYSENYKKRVSEGLKDYYNKGGINAFKGKTHSEESRLKIGSINSIKQSGSNNSQYGSMWITNGIENKKVKSIDYIPEGWYKGRVKKITSN
jgi:hypothetical protein